MTTAAPHSDAGRVASSFSRDEIDAVERAASFADSRDARGVAAATEAAARLVDELPGAVVDWTVFRDEITVTIDASRLVEVARYVRDTLGFQMLADLSPIDWHGAATPHPKRFAVNYQCLKLVPGAPRLVLKVWVDEGEALPSLIEVWPTADWHEREAFDFFGITFENRAGLRRLLMPDDWVGHPLRKDYPLGGEPVKFTNSLRETWDEPTRTTAMRAAGDAPSGDGNGEG